jgi:hypothetical protein
MQQMSAVSSNKKDLFGFVRLSAVHRKALDWIADLYLFWSIFTFLHRLKIEKMTWVSNTATAVLQLTLSFVFLL